MSTPAKTITAHDSQAQPSPEMALIQMLFGKTIAFALGGVARIGVADHMMGEHQPISAMALACGAHEDALYRVLGALSVAGVSSQIESHASLVTKLALILSLKQDSVQYGFLSWFGVPMALHRCLR